jgi:hypothetical protein
MITPASASIPFTPPIPSEQHPNNPDLERQEHESWWRRTLDKVGTILGGDQTYRITKSPDGTMTASYEPSTTGEKWGRVAMAALGGAAKGLANSQGPGGLARAAAAGTEYGLGLPRQQREEVDAQATAEQKRQMLTAQNALIHQNTLRASMEAERTGLELDSDSSAILNKTLEDLKSSPNAVDFGPVKGVNDVMKKSQENAEYLRAHTGLTMKTVPVKGPNGWETHAIATDEGDDLQPVAKGSMLHTIQVDPKTGKSKLVEETVSDRRMTNGKLRIANAATDAEFVKQSNEWMKANKPPAEKEPTLASLAYTAQNDPDPAERQRARKAVDLMKEKAGTGTGAGAGGGPAAEAAATVRNSGGSVAQALSAIPAADQGIIKAIGEGRSAPYSRATKEGQRIMGLVNSVYPDYDASRFPVYQTARTKFTSGTEGQGLSFIRTARNHLARMEDNIPDNVTIPLGIGSAINWAKNTAQRSTDPKLKAFGADMEAVSSEVARAYKGGVIGVEDHKRMQDLLTSSDSPEAIRGAITEFRELLKGKLQSYREQWNSSMPAGVVSPLSTLENLETESDRPPVANQGQGQKAIPAGKFPATLNGQVVGYADDNKGTNYHAF